MISNFSYMTDISEEFKNITGFKLFTRECNYLSDAAERKDFIFNQLAFLYVRDLQKFKLFKQRIKESLNKYESEDFFALAGHIYYIEEDFKKAKNYFLKAIAKKPENLDNWIDLAFALRHIGDIKTSEAIFFNFNYIIYYYKYLNMHTDSYVIVKDLVKEISKHAK